MSVVRVMDIMAQSEESWEDATRQAVAEASRVYPEILSLRVNRLEAVVEEDEVTFFRVKLKLAHVLETEESGEGDEDQDDEAGEQSFAGDEDGEDEEFGDASREVTAQSPEDQYAEDSDGEDYGRSVQPTSRYSAEDEEGPQRRQERARSGGFRNGEARRADAPQSSGGRPSGSGQRPAPQDEPEVARRGDPQRSNQGDAERGGQRSRSSGPEPRQQGQGGQREPQGGPRRNGKREEPQRPRRRIPAYD